jgi:dihydrofolate reductase
MSVVLHMAMSVDGFIAGPDDDLDHGLGVGGEPLHAWLASGDGSPGSYRPQDGPNATVFDEMTETGAVITGRRTFELAGAWDGDHHDGVPVFVLTRSEPADPAPGHARYVTDLEACVAEARAAAGDRDVMVHGAATAQSMLRAGLLDELSVRLMPILLGAGRRLFDDLPPELHELELIRSLEGPGVLHLRYRVRTVS